MASEDESLALDDRDSKQLETAYKVFLDLQRRTLTFLDALGNQEKKYMRGKVAENALPSRIAFIVTPLMVNHYNHMHHIFRASMYGKVPDLCDQTGGIMCTDMSALREELASRTTDTNGQLADMFHSATLPDVQFDFKSARDAVVERAIRMLDAIDIKHPDLTHSVRDDYIQNMRAVQETMTNALEKTRGRVAELQTERDDAYKKIHVMEKTIASLPDETETLRREVSKLKEKETHYLNEITKLQVNMNLGTLESKRRDNEIRLFQELNKRVDEYAASGNKEIEQIRSEISNHIKGEMEKIKEELNKIRSTTVEAAIKRVREEKSELLNLLRTISPGSGGREGDSRDVVIAIKQQLNVLNAELDNSRRQYASLQQRCATLEKENVEFKQLLSASAVTRPDIETSKRQYASLQQRCEYLEKENAKFKQQLSGVSATLPTNIEETDAQTNPDLSLGDRFTIRSNEEKIKLMIWYVNVLINDVEIFFNFFTYPNNIDVALKFADYVYKNSVELKSEYGGHLLVKLQALVSDTNVRQYMMEKKHNETLEVISKSGVLDDINAYRDTIDDTTNKIVLVITALNELIPSIKIAYETIADLLKMSPFDSFGDQITPKTLVPFFERHFGRPLQEKIRSLLQEVNQFRQSYLDKNDQYTELYHKYIDLEDKHVETQNTVSVNSESLSLILENQPSLFRDILYNVWSKTDDNVLKGMLTEAYYAVGIDRVGAYAGAERDLKLFHLVDYTVLTKHIETSARDSGESPLEHPNLSTERFFLDHFINQVGNAQVEYFIKRLDLKRQNKLAYSLFKTFYVPIVNKQSFVLSIEGPFANFNMIYKG